MGFDVRDIRRGMDVYTLDHVLVGTVLEVILGPAPPGAGPQLSADVLQSSLVNGELLGPMPTQPLGNLGPAHQSARAHYAVTLGRARAIGRGAIRVGKLCGLAGRRTFPLDAVQTVSLERVILRLRSDEL